MTADNVIPDQFSTQSWNRFSYVHNNPIIYKDPTGHAPSSGNIISDFLGAVGLDKALSNLGGNTNASDAVSKSANAATQVSSKNTLPEKLNKGYVNKKIEFVDIVENKNGSRSPVSDSINGKFGDEYTINGKKYPHLGTDYQSKVGTKVGVVEGGSVIDSGFNKQMGNYIVVDHGEGAKTRYMHLSQRNVKKGDEVDKGQVIGLTGNTGDLIKTQRRDRDRGEHLHFDLFTTNKKTGEAERVDSQQFNWNTFKKDKKE